MQCRLEYSFCQHAQECVSSPHPKHFHVHFASMLTAITRAVSPGIVNCELTHVVRQSIELAKAEEQHRAYQALLEKCGARVISLPAEPALPDSMFVEDPAIVLDELAVILPLGTETRRPEAASIAQALAKFRKLARVELPGQVEGGDVLRIGRRLFAGLSSRTNAEGIRQLASILAPYGYVVVSVAVTSNPSFHVSPTTVTLPNSPDIHTDADSSSPGFQPAAT